MFGIFYKCSNVIETRLLIEAHSSKETQNQTINCCHCESLDFFIL